ncbi:MAG: AAA family ATPase, partial [Cetobacterium sp.]
MINLKLLETIVLSKIERKARKIDFHDKMTVLTGPNRTGKSSMIKSIFYGFGTDSYFDDKWENAKCIVVNKFKVNNYEYVIYRDKNHFKIFDSNLNLLFETFERK